jgi:hypothetical protein
MDSFVRLNIYGDYAHDIVTQKRIHQLLSKVVDECSSTLFQVPQLYDPLYPEEYCVKVFDMSNPVFLGQLHLDSKYRTYLCEFLAIWEKMWYHGFALYDFKLYRQPNGILAIVDFSKTAFRMIGTGSMFSTKFPLTRDGNLFEHPCFPYYFLERVTNSQDWSELKHLDLLRTMDYHREN